MLVYLYGPPAAGKLTVARRLQELTGYRLFHNHLTVSAVTSVFDFASTPYAAVVHRLRLDVFETAAAHGVDLIFTNNSLWPGFPDFVRRVDAVAGDSCFVQVTAPLDVRCSRVAADDRAAHGKVVDPNRLREMDAAHASVLAHDDDLVIDTSVLSPDEGAALIVAALAR